MPNELRRLLNSHEFFQQAIRDYRSTLSPEHLEGLRSDRDRVFDQIVRLKSDHRNVTLAQINFLLFSLAELAGDQREAERLRKWCTEKVQLLAEGVEVRGLAGKLRKAGLHCALTGTSARHVISPGEARLLDSMTDRAAICDLNYRYLFTNAANARFHGRSPTDFVGQTASSIVGKRIFEKLTTPILSRCFAGESVALTVALQSRGKSTTFAARCEPIRNDEGEVVAAMMISRDVSNLAVTPDSSWRLPRSAGRSN